MRAMSLGSYSIYYTHIFAVTHDEIARKAKFKGGGSFLAGCKLSRTLSFKRSGPLTITHLTFQIYSKLVSGEAAVT